MALICELDEQWSYVGSKARLHWLWYAYNTNRRCTGLRFWSPNRSNIPELLALLTPFNIGILTSDDWDSYGRVVPKISI
ncbi:IS1 family transposase [Escherichia coli]